MADTMTDEAEFSQTKAGRVDAEIARIERSAVRHVHATQVSMEKSAAWAIRSEHTTMRESHAGVVVTRSAASDQSRATVLIAPVVRGDVHTWLDLRTAFAVGVGFFVGKLVLDVLKSVARRLMP